jgi:hypothetical protein
MALLLLAVVAAIALAARAGGSGDRADGGRVAAGADQAGARAQQSPGTPQSTTASTARPSTSSSTTTSLAVEIEIEDEDFTPAKRAAWAQLSDPGRSDLGPELARSVSRLGVAVLRADLTGEGRGAFGDYWAGDRRGPCCRRLEVHAAGASRQPGVEGMAQVTVVWSAESASSRARRSSTWRCGRAAGCPSTPGRCRDETAVGGGEAGAAGGGVGGADRPRHRARLHRPLPVGREPSRCARVGTAAGTRECGRRWFRRRPGKKSPPPCRFGPGTGPIR